MRTKLRPLNRAPLVETVAERLRLLIVHGSFEAGDRLPSETELRTRLRVSRPVLREAINRLAAVGLLSVRHGSGTFVAEREWLSSCTKLAGSAMAIGPRELLQFIEFRRVIEAYAARKAAICADPQQIARLEATLEEALSIAPPDSLQSLQADFRFHCMLVEIGGNSIMRNVMELLQEFSMAGMLRTQPAEYANPRRPQLHHAIMKAIRDHSPEAADQAVQVHMDLVVKRLSESSETPPPQTNGDPLASLDQ